MPWPKGKPRPDNIAKMNAAWRPRPRIRPEKGTNAWRLASEIGNLIHAPVARLGC